MSAGTQETEPPTHRTARWPALAAGLVLVALVVAALSFADELAGWRARSRHPRVILVTLDTLNVWHTGLFSPGAGTTPNLDTLAAEGVLFEHAYTPVPLTLPSHASLLSGQPPWATGVLGNGGRVPEQVLTLPEILSDHGYRTAAFLSLGVLGARTGLDRGFDHYDELSSRRLGRFFRTADEVLPPALAWIEAHSDEPFFLWVHLSDPHAPYTDPKAPPNVDLQLDGQPVGQWTLAQYVRHHVDVDLSPGRHTLTWTSVRPPREGDLPGTVPSVSLLNPDLLSSWIVGPTDELGAANNLSTPWTLELENPQGSTLHLPVSFTGKVIDRPKAQTLDDYRAEVTFADRHLGKLHRFLAARGLERDTLWVVASDHGEGLYAHGSGGHARHTWEEQLRTVLLIKGPGVPAGRRLAEPAVLNQDAFPTVLDVLGLPIPRDVESTSLVPCWTGDGCESPRQEWVAYGLRRDHTLSSAGVYDWPLKAIAPAKGRGGVFNLLADPRELHPLLGLDDRADRSVAPEVRAVRRKLSQAIPELRRLLEAAAAGEIGTQDREMLKGLGYL